VPGRGKVGHRRAHQAPELALVDRVVAVDEHDLGGDDRAGEPVRPAEHPCHGHRRQGGDPLLDREWMHLHPADVDDLGGAAAEDDAIVDDLGEIPGRDPPVDLLGRAGHVPGVPRHAGAGPDPELAVAHLQHSLRVARAPQARGCQAGTTVAHRRDRPELRRGVDLRDPGAGERGLQVVEQVRCARLAAQGDLLQRRQGNTSGTRLRQEEPPVRRGGTHVRDPQVEQGREPVAGLSGKGRDERGSDRHHVLEHLEAGELLRAVGEQPPLTRPGPGIADGAGESSPVVSCGLRRSGRAGRADQDRLRAGFGEVGRR
jgi:hypothetical protein